MSEFKRIIDKRLPLWLRPARFVYRILAKGLPRNMSIRQVKFHGCSMLIWANEDIGKKILLTKKFEADEIYFLKTQVRPGDICFDVGGNTGIYAMLFAKLGGPSGQVHVFEPIHKNALAISLAAEINGFAHRVVVFEGVASCQNGSVNIVIPEMDGAYAHIESRQKASGGILVRSVTLDTYIAQHGITRVDVLKVDVEGAEFDVLRGAASLLRESKSAPRIIMVEMSSDFLREFGASIPALLDYLAGFGYQPYYAQPGGTLVSYSSDDVDKIFNVFFVKTTS